MSEITKWYAGKNVLITGATGFIGKVLVEKILRECDDVNCVYLMIRGKANFEARCKDYFQHLVFENIRNNKPQQIEKVKIFNGDLTLDNLGLSNDEIHEIYDHVHIVLHCGANVRFDLSIRVALNSNTIGTYRMLQIAKQIKHIEVFVFVSTAYSQSYLTVTEERHYESIISAFTLLKAVQRFDDETMRVLQAKILDAFPNTYSLSKHLSEDLVHQYREYFPIAVIRPSVVSSAIQDPLPNYSEGLNGFFGFGMGTSRGVIRSFYLKSAKGVALNIPVDVCANGVIATSWMHGTGRVNQIEYYNASIKHENTTTFNNNVRLLKFMWFQLPLNYAIWHPTGTFTTNKYYHYIRVLLFQLIPALLLDGLIRLFGHKPIMLRVQRKILCTGDTIMPYMVDFRFVSDRFFSIENYLNDVDKKVFNTNMDHLTIMDLLNITLRGLRKYVAKEKDEDIPRAQKTALYMYWLHLVSQTILFYFIGRFIWRRFISDI